MFKLDQTLPWPVASPDEKEGGLSVCVWHPHLVKNLLAIETLTTEFTENTGRGRVFITRTYEAEDRRLWETVVNSLCPRRGDEHKSSQPKL